MLRRIYGPGGVAAALALVFGVGAGSLPGFAGPGYEIALVTGIVVPSIVAVASAIGIGRLRDITPFDGLSRGVAIGAVSFAASVLATMLHGLRVGFCDPWTGLEVLLLGPGAGALLAGIWGWVVSEVGRYVPPRTRRFVVPALALAGPIGGIVVSFIRYYTSPIIFAYDPFAGYFSGTLYDTVIEFGTLGTYRLGSAATTVAVVVAALHLQRDDRARARPRSLGRPGLLAIGAAALVTSLAITASGPALGHWNTRATIEEELGGRIEGDRCLVVFSKSIDRERVRLFASECEAHVVLVERWWGARGAEQITAFLFADEAQKGRLMGASGTNVAKPWRAEVYVQNMDFPHKVIGHELMHVVAASDGEGPFAVAGAWNGFIPNPGLIEGVATAASPKEDDLTAQEWAKAMKDLDILPRLSSLFALGFLGENSSMAYTVSAAFVGWVHAHHGADVVRAWYGGKSLEELTGKSLETLEQAWHADLDAISLDEGARIQGKAKFDRPGFFARRCPRLVDACRGRADGLVALGDTEGALEEIGRARAFEPENPGLRLDEASATMSTDPRRGVELYTAITADPKVAEHARDRAIEALADHALEHGDLEGAKRGYDELLPRTLDESKLRTLHVKRRAVEDGVVRPAIVALLLGAGEKEPDRTEAAAMLGVVDQERSDDGLAPYLLARYFVDVANYASAAEHLNRALARNLDVPRVRIEALRLRISTAVAVADCGAAARTLVDYEKEPDVRAARVSAARRLVDLCEAFPEKRPATVADR